MGTLWKQEPDGQQQLTQNPILPQYAPQVPLGNPTLSLQNTKVVSKDALEALSILLLLQGKWECLI